ncbi:hypothetical protein MLD38_028826 [Melastoma candidum]|uniref:Uncharacterized protein n=1 Tax=Melastoma candidum TaxID=119954 RepID=A0ACB9N282_9MYRT|nr:hypothetical protein MLD38_028826 [Melastoma candidum]
MGLMSRTEMQLGLGGSDPISAARDGQSSRQVVHGTAGKMSPQVSIPRAVTLPAKVTVFQPCSYSKGLSKHPSQILQAPSPPRGRVLKLGPTAVSAPPRRGHQLYLLSPRPGDGFRDTWLHQQPLITHDGASPSPQSPDSQQRVNFSVATKHPRVFLFPPVSHNSSETPSSTDDSPTVAHPAASDPAATEPHLAALASHGEPSSGTPTSGDGNQQPLPWRPQSLRRPSSSRHLRIWRQRRPVLSFLRKRSSDRQRASKLPPPSSPQPRSDESTANHPDLAVPNRFNFPDCLSGGLIPRTRRPISRSGACRSGDQRLAATLVPDASRQHGGQILQIRSWWRRLIPMAASSLLDRSDHNGEPTSRRPELQATVTAPSQTSSGETRPRSGLSSAYGHGHGALAPLMSPAADPGLPTPAPSDFGSSEPS